MLGAIPIVRNSTLWPLFQNAPVMVLDKWDHVTPEQLTGFRVTTKSKKLALAQYWFDRIEEVRKPLLLEAA